mgnify:CR=1 FL=1
MNKDLNDDWTLDWDELFYGAAIRFFEDDKKYLVVGFDENNDFRELFLDDEPDEKFFEKARDIDGYKAVAIFKRRGSEKDFEEPRKSLIYIDSFNTLN